MRVFSIWLLWPSQNKQQLFLGGLSTKINLSCMFLPVSCLAGLDITNQTEAHLVRDVGLVKEIDWWDGML